MIQRSTFVWWVPILFIDYKLFLLNSLVPNFSLHLLISMRNINSLLLWRIYIIDTCYSLNLLIVFQYLRGANIYLIKSFLRIIVYYLWHSDRLYNFFWSLTFKESWTRMTRRYRSIFFFLEIIREHFLLILLMKILISFFRRRML